MARYRVDPERSQVWIDARSSLHGIHAAMTGLEGWFEAEVIGRGRLNLTAAPKGHIELAVDLLSSGNPFYDREMKRRIDGRRYRAIVGELRDLAETGRDGRYLVRGDVTLRDVTRTVEDEMTIALEGDGGLRMAGQSVFDVRDFGIDPPKILTLRVYPDVQVRVDIVLVKEG